MRALIVGIVLAGGLTVVTARSAEAAAPCAVHTWKVKSYSAKDTGAYKATVKGFAGTKLKIAKTGALTWDFTGAKPGRFTVASTSVEGVASADFRLARTLKFRGKLTGTKKGRLKAVAKSASGNALLGVHFVGGADWTTANLVKLAKSGEEPQFYGGSYTCTTKTLKLTYTSHSTFEGKAEKETGTWLFTRA